GYSFYKENQNIKGTLVFAHGLGCGGYNKYMDLINYFAENGFQVFAYDATGHDESEGTSVNGIPQGVIDLSYAIDFVENDEHFNHLPVVLLGHSWGGYSVCSVLNEHPEVKAVVSMAGFDSSADLIKIECERYAGKIADIAVPYMKLYEKIRFGHYATDSSMSGFENSDAYVMIVQSSDDTIVPPEYGYDIYYEKYKDDDRFIFKEYSNRAHKYVYDSEEAMKYMREINSELYAYEKSLEHDASVEEKVKWVNEHLDREKYADLLDYDLMGEMLDMYEKAIGVE
ncbi:MAG: alpha/beta hydrolase, partial [Coprococcus sp.]